MGRVVSEACLLEGCERKAVCRGACGACYTMLKRSGREDLLGDRARLPKGTPLKERLEFHSIPEPMSGCTLWLATADKHGYGSITVDGRPRKAHRVAWELANGPIPRGLCVRHQCDNPSCIQVNHLELGTLADNNADTRRRGRHVAGRSPGEKTWSAVINEEQVREIRSRVAGGEMQKDVAADLGVSVTVVNRVVLRKTWKHVE